MALPLLAPSIWTATKAFFTLYIADFALKALLGMGVSYVTYTGAELAITSLFNQVKSSAGGMSSDMAGLLSTLGVDQFMSLVFAGYTAGLAIRAATGVMAGGFRASNT